MTCKGIQTPELALGLARNEHLEKKTKKKNIDNLNKLFSVALS